MPGTMAEALNLPGQGLLAIVGAGGKTTAMYRLAAELIGRGLRVACTTTTRIFPPKPHQARLILAENNERLLHECRDVASSDLPVCLAWTVDGGKLMGLAPDFIHNLADAGIFDWILVEADGARCLPLKAPAAHEPVIPARSTHVLAVAGLTAIGGPLDENHVCRSARFAELGGLAPGARVTPASVARVCAHPEGMFKGAPDDAVRLLWLNQADMPRALDHGREVLGLLRDAAALPQRACIGAAGALTFATEIWP
ncbi:selenium cofactor biosynthesis protein YqeC [Desulfomicrobium norvegicum]|nr:selenium cofactor biosynthesis protein YqeC [Desulfomicrobium norvegicum]